MLLAELPLSRSHAAGGRHRVAVATSATGIRSAEAAKTTTPATGIVDPSDVFQVRSRVALMARVNPAAWLSATRFGQRSSTSSRAVPRQRICQRNTDLLASTGADEHGTKMMADRQQRRPHTHERGQVHTTQMC
jgi:hypothetical protein